MSKKRDIYGYPPLCLWDTNIPKEKRIVYINPEGFPREALLKGLGLDKSPLAGSFGITDASELKRRLSLFKFLHENPGLMKVISGIQTSEIPKEGDMFHCYYGNPKGIHHWNQVNGLLDALDACSGTLPPGLNQFADALREKEGLQAQEAQMGRDVIAELAKVTIIEGVVTVNYKKDTSSNKQGQEPKFKIDDSVFEIFGHQGFSLELSCLPNSEAPAWKWRYLRTLGVEYLCKFLGWKMDCAERMRVLRSMVVFNLDEQAKGDVLNTISFRLTQADINKHLPAFETLIEVKAHFTYDEEGLKVTIIGIGHSSSSFVHLVYSIDNFRGLTPSNRKVLLELREASEKAHQTAHSNAASGQMLYNICAAFPDFLEPMTGILSPQMDRCYKWNIVECVLASDAYKQIVETLQAHRRFFYEHVLLLQQVVGLVETMERKAQEIGASLCVPVIREDKSVICCTNLYPLHIVGQRDAKGKPIRIVPISGIGDINGEVIGFSGQNAAGKTVAALAIDDNIFLAQSGVGVFGESFELSVKKVVGLVFIQRKPGESTFQAIMEKLDSILKYLEKHDGEDMVIILDELGSATDQDEVLNFATYILEVLSKSGASVIFSAQIVSLFNWAQSKLGARIFKFERATHKMSSGVGNSDPVGLASEMGVTSSLHSLAGRYQVPQRELVP